MSELIENERIRNPRAREDGLAHRLAARVGVKLLARGGQRYADAVIEGLGDPSKAWMSCSQCKRPYVQEWAVREMGHAMNRAMGHPSVQVQVLAMIQQQLGVRDEHEARGLIDMVREVKDLSPDAAFTYTLERLNEYARQRGQRVVVVDEVQPNGRADAGS